MKQNHLNDIKSIHLHARQQEADAGCIGLTCLTTVYYQHTVDALMYAIMPVYITFDCH